MHLLHIILLSIYIGIVLSAAGSDPRNRVRIEGMEQGVTARNGAKMGEWDTFESIISSLHEAALDPDGWPKAAGSIDRFLGTHGSTLACGGGESEEGYRIYFLWTCLRGQRRPDLEQLWLGTLYPLDERIPRLRRLPFDRLFPVADLYTEEEKRTSEAYNAIRTHARAGNGIDVRLYGLGGSRILWQVNDPLDGEGWSDAQLDRIRRLLPHVRQTVSIRQTLAGAGALGATLTEMLDATGLGVIQLDGRGRIVEANDRARDLLRAGDRLLDRNGLLSARSPRDDDDLQKLLGRALPPFGAQGAGGSMVVRRSGVLPPLVLHVNPVGPQETGYPFSPAAALVLVRDPALGTDIDPAVVARALDLTEMESRVAVQLAQGMSVHEIAAATGRKESTIRSHVKRTFAKHGLSRQAELVRLVRPLVGAPGS